jgi:hypothetical protein
MEEQAHIIYPSIMSSSRVQNPAARQAASQQQATLEALVGIAAGQLKEQLTPMIARMSAELADVDRPGLDTREVHRRVRSGKLLRENSYAFFHLASTGIELALRQELERLRPEAGATRSGQAELSLVPFEVMDSKVAFGAVTRPFDIAHSELLATLSVRLGLLLGKGVLRADANPFRPEVFLRALEGAWREFEPEEASHGLMPALLRPELVFDFAPLYEALAAGLTRKDGQPGSVEAYRIQKTDDAAAARAARASGKAALAEQLRKLFGDETGAAAVPLIPDLPDMPSGGGWRPSAAAGFAPAASDPDVNGAGSVSAGFAAAAPKAVHSAGGFVAAPRAATGLPSTPGLPLDAATMSAGQAGPLLDLLARIEPTLQTQGCAQPDAAVPAAGTLPHNVFYLPRFAQSLPRGSLSRGDESTLGLLSRVFETVLLDDSIPPQTRELLQMLQVPVLKAALLDKNFFFEEAHPARRMVDLLSRMGWEQRKDHGADLRLQHRRGQAGRGRQRHPRDGRADLERQAEGDPGAAQGPDRQAAAPAVHPEQMA